MAVLERSAGTAPSRPALATKVRRQLPWGRTVFWLYAATLLLPILWMFGMSIRPNEDILGSFSLFPQRVTLDNYATFFTDPVWYSSYLNSIIYTSLNAVMSL